MSLFPYENPVLILISYKNWKSTAKGNIPYLFVYHMHLFPQISPLKYILIS